MPTAPCTLDDLHQTLRDLRQRADDARRARTPIPRALRSRITRLQASIRHIEKARDEIPADRLARLQSEAEAGFGSSGLNDRHFAVMSDTNKVAHTHQRLLDAPTKTRQIGALRRMVDSLDARLYPISTAAVDAAGRGRQRSPLKAEIALSDEASRRGIEIQSAPEGVGIVVVDTLAANRSVPARNYLHAALQADRLLLQRAADGIASPPGTPTIDIPMGPRTPDFAPMGRERSNGTVIDGSFGERGNQMPAVPDNRWPSPRAALEITAPWHRWASGAKDLLNRMHSLWLRETGLTGRLSTAEETRTPTARLFQTWARATDRKRQADSTFGQHLRAYQNLVRKHRVVWNDETGRRLERHAIEIDNFLEARRREFLASHPDAPPIAAVRHQETFRAEAESRAQSLHPLTPRERAFLREESSALLDPLFKLLGLEESEYRVSFNTRLQAYASRYHEAGQPDVFAVDPTKFWGAEQRWRQDRGTAEIDPSLQRLQDLDSSMVNDILRTPNHFEKVVTYMREAINRKTAGEAIADLQREFRIERSETGAISRMFLGDTKIGPNLQRRIEREVRGLLGYSSPQDVNVRETKVLRATNRALQIKRLADRLGSYGAPRPVVSALENLYESLGARAARGQVRGFLEAHMRLYRGQTFGLNLMASIRDITTTDLLNVIRLPTHAWATAMKETRLGIVNLPKFVAEYRRQVDLGVLPSIDRVLAAPQLAESFRQKPSMAAMVEALKSGRVPKFSPLDSALELADAIQIVYRMTDVGTRMFSNRGAEAAFNKAYPTWDASKKTPRDFDRFLIDSGLVYSSRSQVLHLWTEMQGAMKTGDVGRARKMAMLIHQNQTAFEFARWNSSPYMDHVVGRALGQFGSWSRNMISAQWQAFSGPWRNLSDPRLAAMETAKMGARYALAAEAVYSLGAALNVNTADWIPSVHNVAFTLGPIAPLFTDVRSLLSGDPGMMQRLEKNPGAVAVALARQAFPGIPTTLRRAASQSIEPSEFWRRAMGFPPMQDEGWERWLVSLGFDTFQKPVYASFRRGGPIALGLEATVGRLQDSLSRLPGVAPGTTEEARFYEPVIGGD